MNQPTNLATTIRMFGNKVAKHWVSCSQEEAIESIQTHTFSDSSLKMGGLFFLMYSLKCSLMAHSNDQHQSRRKTAVFHSKTHRCNEKHLLGFWWCVFASLRFFSFTVCFGFISLFFFVKRKKMLCKFLSSVGVLPWNILSADELW